jgi:hypothetical protein
MVKTYGSFKYFHLAQWLALALAPANKINRWFFLGHGALAPLAPGFSQKLQTVGCIWMAPTINL